jgi:hypothetical protein
LLKRRERRAPPQFMESGLFLSELPSGHEPHPAGAPASAGF